MSEIRRVNTGDAPRNVYHAGDAPRTVNTGRTVKTGSALNQDEYEAARRRAEERLLPLEAQRGGDRDGQAVLGDGDHRKEQDKEVFEPDSQRRQRSGHDCFPPRFWMGGVPFGPAGRFSDCTTVIIAYSRGQTNQKGKIPFRGELCYD